MGRKVTFRSVERRHTMIGALVELLYSMPGSGESEVSTGMVQFHQNQAPTA